MPRQQLIDWNSYHPESRPGDQQKDAKKKENDSKPASKGSKKSGAKGNDGNKNENGGKKNKNKKKKKKKKKSKKKKGKRGDQSGNESDTSQCSTQPGTTIKQEMEKAAAAQKKDGGGDENESSGFGPIEDQWVCSDYDENDSKGGKSGKGAFSATSSQANDTIEINHDKLDDLALGQDLIGSNNNKDSASNAGSQGGST